MKIWQGHGSEHSANLVMIGRFKDAGDAARVKEIIDRITDQVNIEDQNQAKKSEHDRYTKEMSDLLIGVDAWIISPSELEQFRYDMNMEVKDSTIVVTTDEYDISAILKLLFSNGARVEVYSAHAYPGSECGRGK